MEPSPSVGSMLRPDTRTGCTKSRGESARTMAMMKGVKEAIQGFIRLLDPSGLHGNAATLSIGQGHLSKVGGGRHMGR